MHLLTVEGALNRQKGDSNPHDWQPPREDFWCEYATAWQGVKDRWGLAMTPRQEDAVEGMHRTSGRLYACWARSRRREEPRGASSRSPSPRAPRMEPVEEIACDTERDYHMTGPEAEAYGLIDHVVQKHELSGSGNGSGGGGPRG